METSYSAPTERLASVPPSQAQSSGQFLTIKSASERFAINILQVQELIESTYMTPLPTAPSFIRGVINLRGKVVAIVDLNACLNGIQQAITKRSSIVLIEIQRGQLRQTIGLLVDEVDEIIEFEPEQIQPAPHLGEQVQANFILAMGNVNGRFIILLDTDKLLSTQDLMQLKQLAKSDPVALSSNE